MRLRIDLTPKGECVLPFNHQYQLASAIYQRMHSADEEYTVDLHMGTGFKFFNFSWIYVPQRRVSEGGIVCESDAYFYCSSPSRALMECLSEGFAKEPTLRIDSAQFEVKNVETMPEVQIRSRVKFRTLSPIILRSMQEGKDGLKTIDLSPKEPLFYTNLVSNLQKKYEAYTGMRANVGVVAVDKVKPKRIQIRDTYNRAYMMDIILKGNPDILGCAYEMGLGEKNSMGFGMVRIVR